jgi:short-subunit dehydrogenase
VSGPTFRERYGPVGVVAGASEGLGGAFAEALAARGLDLVLLARREGPLRAVAARIEAAHGVHVLPVACDLGEAGYVDALVAATREREVGVGIYNAAQSFMAPLLDRPLADALAVVDVNVKGPLRFVHALAPKMRARGRGGLVLMSSIAGFHGAPWLAAYAASKAFNIVLGESLWAELASAGVDVLVSCAGAIRTPNYARALAREAPGTLDPRVVAEETLQALGEGPLVVPGAVNRLARFVLGRMMPRASVVGVMERSTKKLRDDAAKGPSRVRKNEVLEHIQIERSEPRRGGDREKPRFSGRGGANLPVMARVSLDPGSRARLTPRTAPRFAGDSLFDKVARVVSMADCLPRKELFESWEVARRVRRHLRGGRVLDLAGGHGLLAYLCLLLDDSSPGAVVVDRRVPRSAEKLAVALVAAWPRLSGRVELREGAIEEVTPGADDLVVSAHACGSLTDLVLDRAILGRARVAVLPCCHDARRNDAGGLEGWVDASFAIDLTRAARLRAAGYRVRTHRIRATITEKNRLLLGDPRP